MKYPRIFSLSTVGILKHYNQDYLFHPLRTDFVGSNGIGKSIIADLLQMIFVPEKEIVEFGTEGLASSDRLPHRLPYKSNIAYAFLNIEVRPALFIVIGVKLSGSKQGGISPFFIINSADSLQRTEEIGFPENTRLRAQDFIVRNEIQSLNDVRSHIREEKKLYLHAFHDSNGKQTYYKFLYKHQISPIDLERSVNLKAYAQVIQSFSKAKSLNVNSSDSLKEFLFSDENLQFNNLFNKHKFELDKQFIQHEQMSKYISGLETKQKELEKLKRKEQSKDCAQQKHLFAKVSFLEQKHLSLEDEYKEKQVALTKSEEEKVRLAKNRPQLESFLNQTNLDITELKKSQSILEEYKKIHDEKVGIQVEIETLSKIKLPDLSHENLIDDFNIYDIETAKIEQRIQHFTEVYTRYSSLSTMEKKCENQRKELNDQQRNIEDKVNNNQGLLKLFNLEQEGNLLAQVIERGQPLTLEQESLLFHRLYNVHWHKPSVFKDGSKYTDTLEALDKSNIESEPGQNGFWFKLGSIREFVLLSNDKPMFSDPEKFQQLLANKKAKVEEQIVIDRDFVEQINKFLRGKIKAIAGIELDFELREYGQLDLLKETASIILNLPTKINYLTDKVAVLDMELTSLQQRTTRRIDSQNLDKECESIEQEVKETTHKIEELKLQREKESDRLKSLASEIIPERKEGVERLKSECSQTKTNLIEAEVELNRCSPELKLKDNQVVVKTSDDLDEYEQKWSKSKRDYETIYEQTVFKFPETKDENNIEINKQLSDQTYSFPILETVLLGPQIKHVDKIGDTLTKSNEQRAEIAELIYQEMIKIFGQTKQAYDKYEKAIRKLNAFFSGRKISNRYFFQVRFTPKDSFNINWIDKLFDYSQNVYGRDQLPLGDNIEQYVENFFKEVSGSQSTIRLVDLLNPKSYFDLSVTLTDENKKSIPGSTGESYSAIVLLGIGRMSLVETANRPGVRFIILEETANLDRTNFSTFPSLAQEFGYQVITMTPRPYGSNTEKGWYLHHLIRGKNDPDINYLNPASYYKTNEFRTKLEVYLQI